VRAPGTNKKLVDPSREGSATAEASQIDLTLPLSYKERGTHLPPLIGWCTGGVWPQWDWG